MPTRPPHAFDAFAATAPGLAPLAMRELVALGVAAGAPEAGGVAFAATDAALYAANLHLRTASRVLVRVDEFRAATFHELSKRTARIAWEEWLAPGRQVALRVTCRKSRLYHSDAVAERVAEAIERSGGAKALPGARDEDESEDDASHAVDQPQLVVVRLLHDRCTISLDTSGALLHRRGYRQAVAKAPLRETIAAAMLLAAEWEPATPLVDPFCGAGTIPIEAALLARRMAPGRGRAFAFQRWPRFDRAVWDEVIGRARDEELAEAPAPILGSDRDAGAIAAAQANAERAGVSGDVRFERCAVSDVVPPPGRGLVLANPPYGMRVGGAGGDLRDLYAALGATIRSRFEGWRVGLLSPDPRLAAQLGRPLTERLRTSNGGIGVRLAVSGSE
ncbi:MAG TPA: THUMP domain-containing protein [Gemmatimonadales bacterium]|nr:THUMP domain-containing protein [Gemmatimonadales bacterium]